MSGNIKGITIEIGGDTTKLGKALDGVNKQSRDIQSELRQVERLLKLDPTNTTLLEQKQKLLADAVSNTRGKLDTLKNAEKQVQQQFEQGKAGEEQYRAIQREVISTENNLESLEKQAAKANSVLSKDDATKNLANIGKAAGAAAVAAGAALIGMGAAALENADELQRQSDVTGLSAERLQELQYAGNNLGVSLDTITGAQAKLTKAMAAAKDGTGAQADAFAALGISVVDGNGNLRDAKTVMEEAFTALNGVGNETERDALSMKLFGKSAMEMNPLIKAGGDGLKKLSDEARANGAVMSNEAVAGLDTFGDTMESIKNSALGAFGEKFSEILPKLMEFIDRLKEMPQWIQNNATMLELIGVAIGTVTALVIAFNIQQALAASGMTLWSTIAGVATGITTGLGTAFAFLTSPIGLVILAIGAVVAAGILLYKNWDTISSKASELGSIIGGKFEGIRSAIADKINAAKDAVWSAIERIKSFFDFEWSLPHIKLPHFNIEGKFSLDPPSTPYLSVDWYKTGGIFNSPSIIGVGEAGTEAVVPIDKLSSLIADAMRMVGNQSNTSSSAQDIVLTMPIILDGKEITRSTSRIQFQNNLGKARALGVMPT